MAPNFNPIWTLIPNVSGVDITATAVNVNTIAPGTIGNSCFTAFTAGANGSYIQKIVFSFSSTTSVISSIATVLQVYSCTVNTGATTAANTDLIKVIQVPAQAITAVTTAPVQFEIPFNYGITPNRFLLVAQSVAQNANASWQALVIGGDY